jgi:hypothetical protein
LIKKLFLCFVSKTIVGHKQLTFYFQMRKYFCQHLHSSLISMVSLSVMKLVYEIYTNHFSGALYNLQEFKKSWAQYYIILYNRNL